MNLAPYFRYYFDLDHIPSLIFTLIIKYMQKFQSVYFYGRWGTKSSMEGSSYISEISDKVLSSSSISMLCDEIIAAFDKHTFNILILK